MKFSVAAVFVASALVGSASALNPAEVPQFGHARGLHPTGTGDCDGINGPNGQPIKIPCACPPDRNVFIQKLSANVAAGHVTTNPGVKVTFPSGNSKDAQRQRLQASIVTLQNLNGPGKGCPVVSTTFLQQQQRLARRDVVKKRNVDPNLVPQFNIQRGQFPTGTGDCRGFNGIAIPCSCPPDRGFFIDQVNRNVAAGHAVNNPAVALPGGFPTGQDRASKLARLNVATVTLQNLFGPGKGCPQAATDFSRQVAQA